MNPNNLFLLKLTDTQLIRILATSAILLYIFSSCKKEELESQILIPKWKPMTEFSGIGRQNAVAFSIGSKGYIGLGNGDLTSIYNDLWEYKF